MTEALAEARAAREQGEIPIGAVIVKDGVIIGRGHNMTLTQKDPTAHAEILAIEKASRKTGDWRLDGCEMYVTLEPCPMCTGAIINSRIPCLVFGARDAVTGSCGSVIDLFFENYGHHPKVYAGVLGDESAELLRSFFKGLR